MSAVTGSLAHASGVERKLEDDCAYFSQGRQRLKCAFQIRRTLGNGKMSRRGPPLFEAESYVIAFCWGWEHLARTRARSVHVAVVAPGFEPAGVVELMGFSSTLPVDRALALKLAQPIAVPPEHELERHLLRARSH